MQSSSPRGPRNLTILALSAVSLFASAGCGADGGSATASEAVVVGTVDNLTAIDPAGPYDNGSFAIVTQVYPFLMNSRPGSADVVPDIAASAEFTSPREYTVTLKPGLTFANGHALTASDVKFSFDRQLSIADDSGPSYLLSNLAGVEAVDDTKIVFMLKLGDDQTFAQILSSSAAAIVDEEVFSPDRVTSAADIVAGDAFAGQYRISKLHADEIEFTAFAGYQGVLGAPKTSTIHLRQFATDADLRTAIEDGTVDVAHLNLSPAYIVDLQQRDDVDVFVGPGGEIRYLVFNFDTQPFGATTPDADPAKALAVRSAVAHLVDRHALSDQIYAGTYLPLYSYVPDGLTGATTVLESLYGDKHGGPDADAAAAVLDAAGISAPVTLDVHYTGDHYGESTADEYALLERQLEDSGLFEVNLQGTAWAQYSEARTEDYPIYQLGWFPDYSDADNYLTPFFATDNFLGNHYENAAVAQLIEEQLVETDPGARVTLLEDIQAAVAAELPTIPLLQGAQIAVTRKDVSGATLDASFKFRFGTLVK